jgi:sensory rhodopsin
MVDVTLWFALGAVGMLVGTGVLFYGKRWIPQVNRRRYWLLVAVPGIAVLAYGALGLGIGGLGTAGGGTVFVPRYLDWLVTTPMHLLYLGLLVGAARTALRRAVGLQAATILFGFLAGVLGGLLAGALFLAGLLTFLGVVRIVFGEFAAAADASGDGTAAVFRKLRSFVVVLWLVYPVVWLLAPSGVGLMDVETTSLVVAYLDLVAKVGFGLIALNGQLVLASAPTVDRADSTPDA